MLFDGKETFECPRRVLHPRNTQTLTALSYIFWIYSQHEKGFLPEAGGLSDQPALLMVQIQVISAAMGEADAAERGKPQQNEASRPQAAPSMRPPPEPMRG